MFALGYPNFLNSESLFETVLAALTGGITCLFASLTMPKFTTANELIRRSSKLERRRRDRA